MRMRLPFLLVSLSLVLAPSRAFRRIHGDKPLYVDPEDDELPPQPETKNVTYAPVTGAANRALHRMGVDQCGAIRYNYKCEGGHYDQYFEEVGAKVESIYAKAGEQTTEKRKVLFTGNSHTRELAEAYLCQRHKLVDSWRVLGRDGCLEDMPYSTPVIDLPSAPSYRDDLSHATLRGGGSVYMANNHVWTFMGRQGLTEIFRFLGVDVRQLDAVVVGIFNPASWADLRLRGGRVCESYRSPGDSTFTTWDTADFANVLQDMGFSGELILTGMFTGSQARLGGDLSRYNFSVRSLWPVPHGAESAKGHVCLPGLPDLVIADL